MEEHRPDGEQGINSHFAGRAPVGQLPALTLLKSMQMHTRAIGGRLEEVVACGLACSEVLSGRNLAAVLRPGFEYEKRALQLLEEDRPAPPLSMHTSSGVPAALSTFLSQLKSVLPWRNEDEEDDWAVSLHMEGASAVLAAIDLTTQCRHLLSRPLPCDSADLSRWKVAVGATSYHGPPSSSPGSGTPLNKAKHSQILYPVPGSRLSPEEEAAYLREFSQWLEANASSVACMLVEPQWGSTAAATPWPPSVLRTVIDRARLSGILVVADEVMCGLGRHGQGTVFLSEAWGLDVDAVAFGKGIAAGVFPLSGAVLRRGARLLGSHGRTALQSHTYSGGNTRALMTATEVLKVIPSFFPNVSAAGHALELAMRRFEARSRGLFRVQGLGLMWGALVVASHPLFSQRAATEPLLSVQKVMDFFKEQCAICLVLPYFVPAGGFMITPLLDIDELVIATIDHRLCAALDCTLQWLNLQKRDSL